MQDNSSFVEGTSFCLPLRRNVCFGFSLESLQVQLLTCRLFLKLPRRHRVVAPPSSLATFLPRKVIITAFCARKRRLDIPRSRRRRPGQNGSVVGWTFGHILTITPFQEVTGMLCTIPPNTRLAISASYTIPLFCYT